MGPVRLVRESLVSLVRGFAIGATGIEVHQQQRIMKQAVTLPINRTVLNLLGFFGNANFGKLCD